MTSVLTKNQAKSFEKIVEDGAKKIQVTLRFDDRCGNGHNTFSVTGQTWEKGGQFGYWKEAAGGCIHDEIEKYFPEFAHLIRWHLCSTDGPMYYIENTTYMASDKDCWGLKKGEFKPINDKEGLPIWQLKPHPSGYIHSTERPESIVVEYERFGKVGEGKERELDAARRFAVWPDATDEELMSDNLKDKLEARLPALLTEFKKDIEDVGFTW
jgi:hypothetical protein